MKVKLTISASQQETTSTSIKETSQQMSLQKPPSHIIWSEQEVPSTATRNTICRKVQKHSWTSQKMNLVKLHQLEWAPRPVHKNHRNNSTFQNWTLSLHQVKLCKSVSRNNSNLSPKLTWKTTKWEIDANLQQNTPKLSTSTCLRTRTRQLETI